MQLTPDWLLLFHRLKTHICILFSCLIKFILACNRHFFLNHSLKESSSPFAVYTFLFVWSDTCFEFEFRQGVNVPKSVIKELSFAFIWSSIIFCLKCWWWHRPHKVPGVDFTNMFNRSFYECRSQSAKMTFEFIVIFTLLGSMFSKALLKHLWNWHLFHFAHVEDDLGGGFAVGELDEVVG